jgi:uncharacterized radical SAM superfamily Fe-S cluster-containing enzyme
VLFEVTRRCNLSCRVCYADAGNAGASASRESGTAGQTTDAGSAGTGAEADPPLETIAHWFDALKQKAGLCHIQLSGGEPTLRDDLDEIIRLGVRRGFDYFQLNTNGIRLAAEPALAKRLKDAGLTTVFLQFDAVGDEAYRILRGRPLLNVKQQAIAACAQAALPVVLVPTVVREVNDDQLFDIVRFGTKHSPVVRGVHFQPATLAGRWQLGGNSDSVQAAVQGQPQAATARSHGLVQTDPHISIPQLLAALEQQSAGMIRASDFSGGTAEHERCSFNANYYIAADGSLKRLGQATPSCCDSETETEISSGDGIPCCAADAAPATAATPDVTADTAPATTACCTTDAAPATTPCCATDAVARAQDIQKRRWGTQLERVTNIQAAPGSLDEAYLQATLHSFSITGMAFMDSQTLDLERLRRCYIFIIDRQENLVPFCAYNLMRAG